GPHDDTAGASVSRPPSDCQPLQALPVHASCHSASSLPRANTSIRFGPQDTAAGADLRPPPSGSQPPHEAPFQAEWYSWLSRPLPNTSIRLAAHDAAAGLDVNPPPSGSKLGVVPNSSSSRFHSSGEPPP